MPRIAAAFLCLLGVSAVVGCGGSGGGTAVTSAEPISFQQLSQAATTSADATTGRFAFSLRMTMPGTEKPFSFAGEGAFDTTTDRAAISLDFSSFAELLGGMLGGLVGPDANGPDLRDPSAWKIDAVQDGEVVYMRFPAVESELPAGKSWVRVDVGQAARTQGFDFSQLQDLASNDPRKMLDFLRAASGEIETVGTQELRGVSTTHYRATVNLAEYEGFGPASKREQLRSMLRDLVEQTGLDEVPVDVWLDDFGFVRRLDMSFTATQPGTTEALDASMTFELFDYGKQVDVELPRAADVVDASQIR